MTLKEFKKLIDKLYKEININTRVLKNKEFIIGNRSLNEIEIFISDIAKKHNYNKDIKYIEIYVNDDNEISFEIPVLMELSQEEINKQKDKKLTDKIFYNLIKKGYKVKPLNTSYFKEMLKKTNSKSLLEVYMQNDIESIYKYYKKRFGF